MQRMTDASIEPFEVAHLDGLIALVAAEGWTEYAENPDRTFRALSAPGVTTMVALAGERIVGAIEVYRRRHPGPRLAAVDRSAKWRGHRLCSRPPREGLERAGGLWLDIRTRTEGYDERLGASRSLGFRVTREALGLGEAETG